MKTAVFARKMASWLRQPLNVAAGYTSTRKWAAKRKCNIAAEYFLALWLRGCSKKQMQIEQLNPKNVFLDHSAPYHAGITSFWLKRASI